MKELSIEQKAKAYDEAVINGSRLWKCGEITRESYEYIFPELKESEEERMIQYFKDLAPFDKAEELYEKYGFSHKDAIAWLEKQGEQKLIDKIHLGKKYKCIASPRYSTFVKGLIYRPEDKFLCSLMNFCSDCFEPIEDDGQKPIDKVEPKFKVGDWITDGNITIQIEAIKNNCYLYCGDCALYSTKTADKVYHLWTIQDVKDGDILAYGNDIVIFKENSYNPKDQSGCMFVYCAFNKCEYWYEIGGINPTYYKPATKEQRDTLMKAMADARYEWDAEKKELKKIEQNLDWGEEDEKKLNYLIAFLQNSTMTNNALSATNEGIEEWLKSLKDRYAWKPSDEQLDALQYVYRNCNPPISDNLGWDSIRALEMMYQDLKKLKG